MLIHNFWRSFYTENHKLKIFEFQWVPCKINSFTTFLFVNIYCIYKYLFCLHIFWGNITDMNDISFHSRLSWLTSFISLLHIQIFSLENFVLNICLIFTDATIFPTCQMTGVSNVLFSPATNLYMSSASPSGPSPHDLSSDVQKLFQLPLLISVLNDVFKKNHC